MKSRLFLIMTANLVSLAISLPISAHHFFAAAYNMDNPETQVLMDNAQGDN